MSKFRRRALKLVKPQSEAARNPTAGKVVHDERGNAVWDWDVATVVLANKSKAELITSLHEPGTLSLEDEPQQQQEQSGDPYNRPARDQRPLQRR